ncbi:dockerin type I domain-containing protein [Aeoliella sp. SH292]|uniref:dockerin type I domain-containing protein n=1 Tax=Aeoliella sp. SH292 TaxID=3454464 RepID=UPI003F9C5F07
MTFRILATTALVLLVGSSAFALKPITYVDADSLGPNMVGDPTERTTGNMVTNYNVGFDDWVVRDNGIGGDVYQFISGVGAGANGTNPAELVMTIPGLTPGTTYNFYAFFWEGAAGTSGWQLDAALSGPDAPVEAFTNYSNADLNNATGPVYEAAELPFANLASVNTTSEYVVSHPGEFYTIGLKPGFGNDQTRTNPGGTDLDLFAANIGSMTVSASGEVQVSIRKITEGTRVWFDGVGYQVAGLSGDTNNDGQVNMADYAEIASRIGGPAVTPGSLGDVFGDGVVDLRDFRLWQQNRTDLTGGVSSSAVPEPTSLCLAALVVGLAYAGRRRK